MLLLMLPPRIASPQWWHSLLDDPESYEQSESDSMPEMVVDSNTGSGSSSDGGPPALAMDSGSDPANSDDEDSNSDHGSMPGEQGGFWRAGGISLIGLKFPVWCWPGPGACTPHLVAEPVPGPEGCDVWPAKAPLRLQCGDGSMWL